MRQVKGLAEPLTSTQEVPRSRAVLLLSEVTAWQYSPPTACLEKLKASNRIWKPRRSWGVAQGPWPRRARCTTWPTSSRRAWRTGAHLVDISLCPGFLFQILKLVHIVYMGPVKSTMQPCHQLLAFCASLNRFTIVSAHNMRLAAHACMSRMRRPHHGHRGLGTYGLESHNAPSPQYVALGHAGHA